MSDASGPPVRKVIILIIVTTSAFIMPFLASSLSVALPTIGDEFSMDAVMISWISTVYFLAVLMVQVPSGRLADIYGRKKIFILGLLIAICASFLMAFASSGPMLIIGRAIQGVGAGMLTNTSVAILTATIPAEERGQAFGISLAGTYSGLSLGPFIGGVMTEHIGWRSIFILSGILVVIILLMVFWKLRGEWADARGERFDAAGAVVFALSIALFTYGFSIINTLPGVFLLLAGVAGFLIFGRLQARSDSPILNLGLFSKNRAFVFSILAALITFIASFAVSFLSSLYLQYIHGLSPQMAGLVLVSPAVVMTIFTPVSGRLSDKVAPRLVASAGNIFIFMALFLFIFLGEDTPIGFVIAGLVLYGMGMGIFSSPNSNAIMSSVEKRHLGVASGVLVTTRSGGMLLSMGITIVLFSIYMGQAEVTPDLYPEFLLSLRTGFIVFSALGLVALLLQFNARKSKRA
jgi:MFS family permease